MTIDPTASVPTAAPLESPDFVRVKLGENDVTFEVIKNAIYAQARYLHEHGKAIQMLLLSKDLFEILNRRLVFKTPAHKDLPHFITPYGNLEVAEMSESLDEPISFIIQ